MTIWRASAAAGAIGFSLALAAMPAVSQDSPESLLPPGFDQPVQPEPQPSRAPGAGVPQPQATQPGAVVQPIPDASPTASATPTPTPGAVPMVCSWKR